MKNRLVMALSAILCLPFVIAGNATPTMSRIYGNQFTPQINPTQDAGQIGALVPTGVFGSNGTLSCAGQVPNAQAVATQVLDNGIIVVSFSDGTNTYLVEYTQTGQVYANFAQSTGNVLVLAGYADPSLFMTIDEQGRILLSGDHDRNDLPWIVRITSDGVVDTNFNFVDGAGWTSAGVINQLGMQSTGKIIAVGGNGLNAMIARYNLDGSLDQSFEHYGHLIFDGSLSGLYSSIALRNLVIDTSSNIYIAYFDSMLSVYVIRLTPSGAIDTTWNAGNGVMLSYLADSFIQTDQLSMIQDLVGDVIVAVPCATPSTIKAASVSMLLASTPGIFANFSASDGVFGLDDYALYNMMATSDGSVYFLGSNLTSKQMAIIRCTSAGILDTSFHSSGVNFFYPTGSMPTIYGALYSGAVAPDGQIFVAGAQLDAGITTAYLSSLYNNQYVNPVAQFPQTQEQGTLDDAFGSYNTQVYTGIVSPFVGLYRANLQQKAQTVIELESGNILIGMHGYLGSNPVLSNMMLIRLNSQGSLDGAFGINGALILDNITGTNEYITSLLEDGMNNIYVTGYSDLGAIFRKYDSAGNLLWNSDYLYFDYRSQGAALQGQERVLLFLNDTTDQSGQVNAYLVENGAVDMRFNDTISHPGQLDSADYGLHLGALFNGITDVLGTTYIAYKNTVTQNIDVAAIVTSGTATLWVASNIFSSTLIAADNVRISFNAAGDIAVSAAYNGSCLVTVLDAQTGLPTADYPVPLSIACATSLHVSQMIGVSDGTLMIIGYDGMQDGMLVVRVASNGTLDTSFDAQGALPGVAKISIGDQIAHYYARVGSGIAVQSHIGNNQGNVIMSGYEQLFMNDATPMIMRLFANPGTTQVPNCPKSVYIPGTFDTTYGTNGVAENYVAGQSAPGAYQEVAAIRQLVGSQMMTIVQDYTTCVAYLQRLNADGSIDTTFGQGFGIALPKMPGIEIVQSLVFDGAGNFLITGMNETYGGYVKRIMPDGTPDSSFGGASQAPLGTVYGLMDTVNACQQLTNGQIVIVGSLAGVGTVQMLTYYGAVMTSFGSSGVVNYGQNMTSVSVDASNNLYASFALQNGSAIDAGMVKLSSSGQELYRAGQALSNVGNTINIRSAFDQDIRPVIAAASYGNSGQVMVNRLTTQGTVDTTFNHGQPLYISFTGQIEPGYVFVTGLVTLQTNQILVSGCIYDPTTAVNNYEFIVCVNHAGQLDGSFGDQTTPGLMTLQVVDQEQIARRLTDLNIQTDGKILMAGGQVVTNHQEIPFSMRLHGYPQVQAVPQFTGYNASLPDVLNPNFHGNGIAYTSIADLDQIGNVVVDAAQQIIVGGVTSTGLFQVVRYLPDGSLDSGFGIEGIATTSVPIEGLTGGYLTIDGAGKILISGMSDAGRFIVAKFTNLGQLDSSFAGGMVQSSVISNLVAGGYICANIITGADYANYPLIAGYTSDGKLVAVRFADSGIQDLSFGQSGLATAVVPSLLKGGGIACDLNSSIYLAGITIDAAMVVVKMTKFGLVDTIFANNGIATTGAIANGLVDGGSVKLDGQNNIIVGGLTANQSFVVARFTPGGSLDPLFNDDGIAYSMSVDSLTLFGNITIDNSFRIVCGGVATNYDTSKSMIVARFTPQGILDTVFTSLGMATTGSLQGLLSGGYVATDTYANIVSVGLTDATGCVATEMYSGEEIFITNTSQLSPVDTKLFYYGNSLDFMIRVLGAEILAQVIQDQNARQATLLAVADIVNNHYLLYRDQPGWNVTASLYRQNNQFTLAADLLIASYPRSQNDLIGFFELLFTRINAMKFSFTVV